MTSFTTLYLLFYNLLFSFNVKIYILQSHYSYFNKKILNPIKRYGSIGDGRKAFLTLKDNVLNQIMLRRTKKERSKDIELPPLTIKVEMLELDEHERDFYSCIYKRTRSKFDTYVKKGKYSSEGASIATTSRPLVHGAL